jgi:hypothetical protein
MAAAAAVGALAMIVVSELVDGGERATALAGAYGGAFTLAGVLVWIRLHRALGPT